MGRHDGGPSCDSYRGMNHAIGGVTRWLACQTSVSESSSNRPDPAYPVRPLCDASGNRIERHKIDETSTMLVAFEAILISYANIDIPNFIIPLASHSVNGAVVILSQ